MKWNATIAGMLIAVGFASASHAQVQVKTPKQQVYYDQGRQEAQADILCNKLSIRTAGLLLFSSYTGEELLKKRYGIEVIHVAACIVDEKTSETMDGYNSIARQEIEMRFGKGVIEKTYDEAAKNYHKQFEAPAKKGTVTQPDKHKKNRKKS